MILRKFFVIQQYPRSRNEIVLREVAEMEVHPAVAVDRNRPSGDPNAGRSRHDTLSIQRVAGNLHGKTKPRLAIGSHYQRDAASDAVSVRRHVDQAATQCHVVEFRDCGKLGRPTLYRRRQLPVDWRIRQRQLVARCPVDAGVGKYHRRSPDDLAERDVHRLQSPDFGSGWSSELGIKGDEGCGL
jgi:hypothetical protein